MSYNLVVFCLSLYHSSKCDYGVHTFSAKRLSNGGWDLKRSRNLNYNFHLSP
jgi:hypothetical protein